jgi:sterol desaturase/sphingolipid hydroxylase (fatty acid hydroxylase superfamily)
MIDWRQLAFFSVFALVQVVVFGWIEWRWGARRIEWRKVLLADLVSVAFLGLVTQRVAAYLNVWTNVRGPWPAAIATWPFALRLLLFFLVADFAAYWMHRLVHIGLLWRVHRWHHSPTHMYWLAGSRTSILQQTLFNLPYIFASPILGVSPWWVVNGLFVFYTLANGWMHMNVRWQMRGVDWILVTPRSHHIHHSKDPQHHGSNFGVVLSVWDRLFGTFRSPRDIDPETLRFGIGERVPIAKLAVGL